jgi:AcrR family transcriptional regulator
LVEQPVMESRAHTRRNGTDVPSRLLRAAVELLTERAPSSVTGRELAARANANYGLIHHYFGSKNDLLRAALLALTHEFQESLTAEQRGRPVTLTQAAEHPELWRAMANLASDPSALEEIGWDFPVLRQMTDNAVAADPGHDPAEARARVVAATIMTLGWTTYEGFVRAALDIDDEHFARVRRVIERFLEQL